jgi:cephalosporin hydroxylase
MDVQRLLIAFLRRSVHAVRYRMQRRQAVQPVQANTTDTQQGSNIVLKLPAKFYEKPLSLVQCDVPSSAEEIQKANGVRFEYLLPGETAVPYMEDVVRAFRLAQGAKVYIEVGSQDKGNIAWLARTKLAKGATIIDIDFNAYPENDAKITAELAGFFDYHQIRGDCLSDDVLDQVNTILAGRPADIIFCDSHYTFSHTITEFALYYPLVKQGGFLLFHDAQWPGDPTKEGEEGLKGKGLAIEQIDRFYPTWMTVGPEIPLHRAMPIANREGHWGTLAIIPA